MTLSSWFKLIVEILWKSRQSICVFRICLLRLSCSCDKCRGRGGLTALMFEVNWCAAFSNPDCRLCALFTRAGPANLWNTHLASWQIGNDGSTNPTIRKSDNMAAVISFIQVIRPSMNGWSSCWATLTSENIKLLTHISKIWAHRQNWAQFNIDQSECWWTRW